MTETLPWTISLGVLIGILIFREVMAVLRDRKRDIVEDKLRAAIMSIAIQDRGSYQDYLGGQLEVGETIPQRHKRVEKEQKLSNEAMKLDNEAMKTLKSTQPGGVPPV